jgi:hypothetical protein
MLISFRFCRDWEFRALKTQSQVSGRGETLRHLQASITSIDPRGGGGEAPSLTVPGHYQLIARGETQRHLQDYKY